MTAEEVDGENTNRLLELLAFAAGQHAVMKPEEIDLSIPEPTLKIGARIPFHEITGDLVSLLVITLVGVFKLGNASQPKLRALREARERIEHAFRTAPPAAEFEPVCAKMVELAGQIATKFGAGVHPDAVVDRFESKATIIGGSEP